MSSLTETSPIPTVPTDQDLARVLHRALYWMETTPEEVVGAHGDPQPVFADYDTALSEVRAVLTALEAAHG